MTSPFAHEKNNILGISVKSGSLGTNIKIQELISPSLTFLCSDPGRIKGPEWHIHIQYIESSLAMNMHGSRMQTTIYSITKKKLVSSKNKESYSKENYTGS